MIADLEMLANQWSLSWRQRNMSQWRFARKMVEFVGAHPKISWDQIGVACAVAVDRETPYVRDWARHIHKAGTEFQDQPPDDAAWRRFKMLFHGHQKEHRSQSHAQKEIINSPERSVSMAVSFAMRAVDQGVSVEAIIQQIKLAYMNRNKNAAA